MRGGIRAFVDYFEIVPGSNLVTEYLDCMTLTSPASRRVAGSARQPSSLQRSAAAPAARRGGNARRRPAGTILKRLLRVHTGTFLCSHPWGGLGCTVSPFRTECVSSLGCLISRFSPTSPYPSCRGEPHPHIASRPTSHLRRTHAPALRPSQWPVLPQPAAAAPRPFPGNLPPTELRPHPPQAHALPGRRRDGKQSRAWGALACRVGI